jgi:hypothetical protein
MSVTGSALPTPRIYAADADHCLGTYQNVILMNWRGEYPLSAIAAAERAHRDLLRQHPGGLAGFHIVESTSKVPSNEARKAAIEMLGWSRGETLCVAVVILGEGFFLSTLQSIAVSLFSLTARLPTGNCRTIEEGARFLAERVEEPTLHVPSLVAAVEAVRQVEAADD